MMQDHFIMSIVMTVSGELALTGTVIRLDDGALLSVRRLSTRTGDVAAARELLERCDHEGVARRFGRPGAVEALVPWLLPRRAGDIALLVEGDTPAAIVNANLDSPGVYALGVLVAPTWRRRGVATRALRHLEELLVQPVTLVAHIQADNGPALRMRRRLAPDAPVDYAGSMLQFVISLPREGAAAPSSAGGASRCPTPGTLPRV